MQETLELDLLDPLNGLPGADMLPVKISKLVFRAPRLREYERLGDLDSFARTAEGAVFMTENEGVFAKYTEACLTSPEPSQIALVRNLSLRDSLRLKDMWRDFFTRCRVTSAVEASPKSEN